MMRLSLLATFLLLPPTAFAFLDQGPPPWYCSPISACNGEKSCAFVPGFPIGFDLEQDAHDQNKVVLHGLHDAQRVAKIYPSLEEAKRDVEANRLAKPASIILIPDNGAADARGFSAYTVMSSSAGRDFISQDHLAITYGRILAK